MLTVIPCRTGDTCQCPLPCPEHRIVATEEHRALRITYNAGSQSTSTLIACRHLQGRRVHFYGRTHSLAVLVSISTMHSTISGTIYLLPMVYMQWRYNA